MIYSIVERMHSASQCTRRRVFRKICFQMFERDIFLYIYITIIIVYAHLYALNRTFPACAQLRSERLYSLNCTIHMVAAVVFCCIYHMRPMRVQFIYTSTIYVCMYIRKSCIYIAYNNKHYIKYIISGT